MGECLKRGGVSSEVDLVRGPAHCATGTQGSGRGGVRQESQRTTGTRCWALRGGKGGSRAFGRRLREKVGGGATLAWQKASRVTSSST